MIEASQRVIRQQNSPATNRHFDLQIKTLQNAPRDSDKLQALLKLKEREKQQKVADMEHTQRLVTEIEMLKVALYLVSRGKDRTTTSTPFQHFTSISRRLHYD